MSTHCYRGRAHLPAVTRRGRGHTVGTGLGMPGGSERREGGAGESQGEHSVGPVPAGTATPPSGHGGRPQSPDLRSFQIKLEVWGFMWNHLTYRCKQIIQILWTY